VVIIRYGRNVLFPGVGTRGGQISYISGCGVRETAAVRVSGFMTRDTAMKERINLPRPASSGT